MHEWPQWRTALQRFEVVAKVGSGPGATNHLAKTVGLGRRAAACLLRAQCCRCCETLECLLLHQGLSRRLDRFSFKTGKERMSGGR